MRVSEPYKKDSVTTQTKARTSFLVQLCVEIICIHFFTGLTLKAFILPIAKFFCPGAFIQVIFWKEILKFSLTRVVNRTRKTATHRSIEMQWLKTKMNQFFFLWVKNFHEHSAEIMQNGSLVWWIDATFLILSWFEFVFGHIVRGKLVLWLTS